MKKIIAATSAVALTGLLSTGAVAGDFTANAGFSNNYLWRGSDANRERTGNFWRYRLCA